MRELFENLAVGLRLVTGLPVDPARLRPGVDAFLALVVTAFAVNLAGDWLATEPPREFDVYGLAGHAAVLVCAALAFYLASRLARLPDRLVAVATSVAAADVWLGAGLAAVELAPPGGSEDFWWLVLAWLLTALLRAFALPLRARRLAAGTAAVLYLAAAVTIGEAGISGALFHSTAEPRERVAMPADPEALMYRQIPLLTGALSAVQAGRPGVVDLYFVGFGGDSTQDVFAREVRYAQTLFDREYDTTGRSVILTSEPKLERAPPIASASNLAATIRMLGERMNRDEDVLFLYLTSHGTKQRLSVHYPPLPLNDVRADDLKRWLDEAGIRWRVLVVSACYSGSFIDRLATDSSLVLTASAADRTSFGCENGADFTWFGRALLADALGNGTGMIESFRAAMDAVGARERRAGEQASMPQLHVGPLIDPLLIRLDARLRRLRETREEPPVSPRPAAPSPASPIG
ncbi:MAG: hypothetical protein KDG50_09390 [Chromatiales bacterium]|nr:hypothetical protein [Chromatiales bacterium]